MIQAHRVYVHLAPHEWSHEVLDPETRKVIRRGDIMREAADEVFAAHPDLDNLVVEVREHGGWYLSYNRWGTILESANDAASLSKDAKAFWTSVKDATWTTLPSIRRGE